MANKKITKDRGSCGRGMCLTERSNQIASEAVSAAIASGERRGRPINVNQYALGWLASRCARLEVELRALRALKSREVQA